MYYIYIFRLIKKKKTFGFCLCIYLKRTKKYIKNVYNIYYIYIYIYIYIYTYMCVCVFVCVNQEKNFLKSFWLLSLSISLYKTVTISKYQFSLYKLNENVVRTR